MVVLESCPKHNMVSYLEKTNENAEFHDIIDFLTQRSIHYALIVIGKPVTIFKASIRSDLRFDDADGIDSLNNQAIFDAIKLMGTVKRKNQNKKKVLKTLKRRSVFKQGRKTIKSSKGAPTVPTNNEWDDLDMDIDDTMNYTLAQDEGKTDKVDEKGETQRRFLAEQRAIAIRNKPPTRTQLRNQMMTYLKHVGNKKHSDLKNKTFEEIQALYEKVEKLIARKKPRQKSDVDSEDEHRKCLKIVPLDSKIDIEVMETKSVIARLNKVSSPDGDYLVIYRANGNFRAFNCLLEVLHIFDRQDLFHLKLKDGTVIHMLVERRYPLSKDLLQRMLDLGLEVERESTTALRFDQIH
ncbi:hypothetical protein Tco_0183476 [Tanacetum coccineum]